MDNLLNLFNSEQYTAVYNCLIKQQRTDHIKLLDQLLLSNNIAVCKLLMTQRETSFEHKHEDTDFINILRKCYSIPAREQSLVVELTVLYNYMYHELVAGRSDDSSQCYSLIYKSCQRVLVCVSIGQKIKKSDVLNYQDMKAAVWSTIQSCLTLLQLHSDSNLLEVFLRLAVFLCLKEIMNNGSAIVRSYLFDINKIFSKGQMKVNTQNPEILALRMPLYQDHVQFNMDSREDFTDVSSLLLSVCLSGCESWEEVVKILERNDSESVKSVSQFFLGFALFKMDKISESVSCLMEVLRCCDSMTQRLKARVCNLIGQCFLKLDKCHLSVQMFKEALCADFSFLLPLYNTALQYRKQGMNNLELECLNLLVTALEMRNSPPTQKNRVDLLSLIVAEDEDVQYVFVLYSLAKRTLQLERFDVASEKYLQLIEYLKSRKGCVQHSSKIPSLIQIHHEVIESLYRSEKYVECISLCDKLILCCHGNITNDSVLLSQTFDQSFATQSQGTWNDSLTIEQTCTPVACNDSIYNSQSGSQTGRKRKHSEIVQSQKDDENFVNVDVLALRYKAESMYKMGDHTMALSCLQRALDSITSCRRKRLRQCMNQITDSVGAEPDKKKQKTVSTSSSSKDTGVNTELSATNDSAVDVLEDSIKSLELERILYEKTAEILTALKKTKDAQHFVRLAEQIKFVEQKKG